MIKTLVLVLIGISFFAEGQGVQFPFKDMSTA
ncbi:MAG: hypothetical protein ACI8UX_002467, partial [Psychromonas sp.]